MASDSSIQVQPESTGKKVETREMTRDDGVLVQRQVLALADPDNVLSAAAVSGEKDRGKLATTDEQILQELRIMNEKLHLIYEVIYQTAIS